MAVRVVPHLREALGDEGVDELITLVDERVREQAVPRDEYQQVIAHLQRIDDRFIEMTRYFEVRFDELSRHLENRFDRLEQRLESRIDSRLDEMGQHLESRIDIRLAGMDQRLDRMDQRLDRMDQRLDRMDQRLDRMDQRFDEMYDRMLLQSRWLIGSIALLGTVISLLLAIGQFVK